MRVDDNLFWSVAESAHFRKKFGNRHPLLRDNGGVEFYNVTNLTQLMDVAAKIASHGATDAKNAALMSGRVLLLSDWLEQVEYINQHPIALV